MKIFNSKKSSELWTDWPFWMVLVAFIGIFSVAMPSLGNASVKQAAEIPFGIEEITLIQEFYNSESCFAYKDVSGKVHTKVIDITKFEQENMDKCFPNKGSKYSFSLTLEIPELNKILGPLKTSNWVEGFSQKKIKDILVIDGKKYKAKLKIGIKNVR